MSGQIKKLIDKIIEQRANGNSVLVNTTRVKMMLKGINPDKYTVQSEDDPVVLDKLSTLAKELNLTVKL